MGWRFMILGGHPTMRTLQEGGDFMRGPRVVLPNSRRRRRGRAIGLDRLFTLLRNNLLVPIHHL